MRSFLTVSSPLKQSYTFVHGCRMDVFTSVGTSRKFPEPGELDLFENVFEPSFALRNRLRAEPEL